MDQQPTSDQSLGSLIDTSILIAAERGRIRLAERLRAKPDGAYRISVITVSELMHGLHRATEPTVRLRRQTFIDHVLHDYPTLGIDVPVARTHAALWAGLEARGEVIGAHDLWIAATCLTHGLGLVTANVREFQRVPGLQVEEWPPSG